MLEHQLYAKFCGRCARSISKPRGLQGVRWTLKHRIRSAVCCCLLLPAAACCCLLLLLLLPAAACCCLLLPAAACCCLLLPAAASSLLLPPCFCVFLLFFVFLFCVCCRFGASFALFSTFFDLSAQNGFTLGPFGAHLGHLGPTLGPYFGYFWDFGAPVGTLCGPWWPMLAIGPQFGSFFGHFWEHFWSILGIIFGPFFGHRFWKPLGANCASFWDRFRTNRGLKISDV